MLCSHTCFLPLLYYMGTFLVADTRGSRVLKALASLTRMKHCEKSGKQIPFSTSGSCVLLSEPFHGKRTILQFLQRGGFPADNPRCWQWKAVTTLLSGAQREGIWSESEFSKRCLVSTSLWQVLLEEDMRGGALSMPGFFCRMKCLRVGALPAFLFQPIASSRRHNTAEDKPASEEQYWCLQSIFKSNSLLSTGFGLCLLSFTLVNFKCVFVSYLHWYRHDHLNPANLEAISRPNELHSMKRDNCWTIEKHISANQSQGLFKYDGFALWYQWMHVPKRNTIIVCSASWHTPLRREERGRPEN